MRKFLISAAVAGGAASLTLLGLSGSTIAAHAACPGQTPSGKYNSDPVASNGGPSQPVVYTSDSAAGNPMTATGWVGVNAAGTGYVEANSGTANGENYRPAGANGTSDPGNPQESAASGDGYVVVAGSVPNDPTGMLSGGIVVAPTAANGPTTGTC